VPFVLGREDGSTERPTGLIGSFRAVDGSDGAPLHLDLDRPHAALVVGKRGYGKSHSLGVIAEELARADSLAPVVVDPMGVFETLAAPADGEPVAAEVIDCPTVPPDALDPRSWCAVLGLDPESGPGGLVWRAARRATTVSGMVDAIEDADAPDGAARAAINHVKLAASWEVFDDEAIDIGRLASSAVTVLDVSGLADAPMNAVVRGVAEALYAARVAGEPSRLPWLLIDEAHTFFDGVARAALHRLLTRGRSPGVSLVLATQRPSAVSEVAVSQSDLLVAHRLTSGADLDALAAAQPTYLERSLGEQVPTDPGEVVIVDDTTETVQGATIRARDTPHGGESPAASDL